MITLELMILLFIIPFATVGLSLLYDKCMEEGMIFRRWYLLLMHYHMKWWRKKDRYKRVFIKPFFCIYCGNVWIGVFMSLYLFSDVLMTLIYLGIQYIYLELLMLKIN